MKPEAELLALLREYRGGSSSLTEHIAMAYLGELADMQRVEESFVIASSVDIPEIDHADSFSSAGSTNRRAADELVDLCIILTLREEFRILYHYIKEFCRVEKDPNTRACYYLFSWPSETGRPYKCVAIYAGEMGNGKAGLVTQRLLVRWAPSTVAILGIAAGIADDVRIGDVLAATQVDAYLENSKAGGSAGLQLQLSGEVYRPSLQVLNEIRNFEFASNQEFEGWREKCEKVCLTELHSFWKKLVGLDILRLKPVVVDGHIASGPTVGASLEFVEWLKNSRDRKYIGLEMESAGMLSAIYESCEHCQSLVLRGVSDYGDERKTRFDKSYRGALRAYAAHAVVLYLWSLLGAGALLRNG